MFRSFFQAGFEGSTGYNQHGQWIDQIAATQHDLFVDEDYRLLRDAGLLTARETVRWSLVDRTANARKYEFASIDPMLAASEKHGIELIYDLFHFGYNEWTQMGLWELRPEAGTLKRILHAPMMHALREAQTMKKLDR